MGISYQGVAKHGRRKFCPKFFAYLTSKSLVNHFRAYFRPHWPCHTDLGSPTPAELKYTIMYNVESWYQFWSMLMMLGVEQRAMLTTAGFGQHEHQWVKAKIVNSVFRKKRAFCFNKVIVSIILNAGFWKKKSNKTPANSTVNERKSFLAEEKVE